MGRLKTSVVAVTLVAAACGPAQDEILFSGPPETSPPTTTTVTTTAITTTIAPTTTVTTLAATQQNLEQLASLMTRIGEADPFGPQSPAFHFEATLTMLDTSLGVPADRGEATFVLVLGATGEASRTSATFEYSDPLTSTRGRILDANAWIEGAEGWEERPIDDPAGEVLALSYGNWRDLLLQMMSLTAQFTDDADLEIVSNVDGHHIMLRAGQGATDPLLIAGLPTITELWLDTDDVIRQADVQGFILWQATYIPAAMTFRLEPGPAPTVVSPFEAP